MLSANDIIALGAFVLTAGGVIVAITRWIVGRISTLASDVRSMKERMRRIERRLDGGKVYIFDEPSIRRLAQHEEDEEEDDAE